ncbi:hypothetical protein JX266_004944 [Neoarthrinium moseri]|nr:hypothetical protein JX266_004944 [Neoarthrinium moseri]
MVALRINNTLRAAGAAARYRTPRTYRTFITTPRSAAQQGYGDGKGSPEAENPQDQPASSKAQESGEHPGPAPPDVGKGTGGGPTKAAFKESMNRAASSGDPADASASSGGSRSKQATETGSSPTGGEIKSQGGGEGSQASRNGGEALKGPQGDGAPKPKLYNQAMPGDKVKSGLSDEQKKEVEDHNADFEKRHDRASPASNDKVDKSFWKGS